MPFTVERPSGGDDSLRKLLDTMESNNWTLVQVVQAYDGHPPQFIFHKPLSEREETLRQAGEPRID